MRSEKSWTHWMLERMQLPGETLPRQPILELCGDSRVLIENHGGVTVYTPDRIQVRVRFGQLAVTGANLRLCRMQNQQLFIRGQIDEVIVLREG